MKLRMMKAFFLVMLAALTSCGQDAIVEEGKTRVVFSNQSGSRVSLNKGVMIYAHHLGVQKSTTVFGPSISGLPNQDLILPNGQYLFFAHGYDGAPEPMLATRYCGIANNGNPITLSGGTTTVNITLAQTGICPSILAPGNYRDVTASNALKTVYFIFCTTNQIQSNCAQSTNDWYQISIIAHRTLTFGPDDPGIVGCFQASTGIISPLYLPFAPGTRLGLKRWTGSSCTGSPGPFVVIDNLLGQPAPQDGNNFGVDTTLTSDIYIKIKSGLL